MEPEGSSPHKQAPATCPCPEPDESSSCFHFNSLRCSLTLSSELHRALPSVLFISGPQTHTHTHQTLYAPLLPPMCVTCPVQNIFLRLINRIEYGED